MSFNLDDANIGGQLKVGTGICPATGEGATKVNGSAMIEGPVVLGNPTTFPSVPYATVNIAPLTNTDSLTPLILGGFCYGPPANPFSLAVSGSAAFMDEVNTAKNVVVGGGVKAQFDVEGSCGLDKLSRKKDKPFDMPHPNKKGWRLRHVCIEGPEIAVYCRGKIPPDGVIDLPSFWHGLVDPEDMSISLTPRGRWQELFVKEIRWGKQVIVQNNGGGQMEGDYYIVARRLDDDLIVEYEGESHEDYPGGNEGYSFDFEHNYVEGLIRDMVHKKVEQIEKEKD